MTIFERKGPVWETLERAAAALDRAGTPHALIGGLACFLHGYRRNTVDVDLLVGAAAGEKVRAALEEEGFTHDEERRLMTHTDEPEPRPTSPLSAEAIRTWKSGHEAASRIIEQEKARRLADLDERSALEQFNQLCGIFQEQYLADCQGAAEPGRVQRRLERRRILDRMAHYLGGQQ